MKRARGVLAFTLALMVGVGALTTAPTATAAAADEADVAVVIDRLQEYYLEQGDEVIIANGVYLARSSEALDYVASQETDGSWPDVDYADRTSSANGRTWSSYIALYRMLAMAQAYRDPETAGFEDPALVTALERALVHWDTVDPGNENWWETEVGESMAMGRIGVFLGDVLSGPALQAAFEHNTGRLDPVGANGAWRTTNYLFEAVAKADIGDIRTGFATMVKTVEVDNSGTVQEAVQPDASFWAHGAQLYSEGYGMALFANIAIWADAARSTDLAFTRAQLDAIAFYIVSGTRWMIRGEVGMLYLGYRPPKTVDGVTGYAAEFLDPLDQMARTDSLYATAYRELADSIRGRTRGNGVTGNRYFWRSEFSSHLREEYGIFTRLNSSRTVGSEYRSTIRPKVGNEIAWSSAGATAIQVNNREYLDLGPAFDWFHYPGVTAPYVKDSTTGPAGRTSNGGSFTGGVSDGRYGASVHTLDRAATRGLKSYFSFDDEMVALGTGIESTSASPVHSVVNQAAAKSNASIDGRSVAAGVSDQSVADPQWAYNDEVGYVFPSGQDVQVTNATQTGSWLNGEPVEAQAFTLHFDHGVQPKGAGYEYIVLPAKKPQEVAAYAAKPAVQVLSNTTDVQAVRHAGLQRTMATFFRAGDLDLGDGRRLRVSGPSILILDESGAEPVVSVASPDRPNAIVQVALVSGERVDAQGTFVLGTGANLGKTVTAPLSPADGGQSLYSASDSADGHPAALAGDGSPKTVWRSGKTATAWLAATIGGGRLVTGVDIDWGSKPAATYLVQTSLDGTAWTDQRLVQNGTGNQEKIDLGPVEAAFVRILMLDGKANGYWVREFAVRSSANLAIGGTVTASGGTTPAAVADGNQTTRWSANNTDTSWIQVDLGSVRPVGAVRLAWEASFARQYSVQVSDDGKDWRDAYRTTGTGSDGALDAVKLQEQARFVRVQTRQRSTTRYGVSLWELEVYEHAEAGSATAPAGRANLALGRPITADSTFAHQDIQTAYANDGLPGTRWASLRQDAPYTTERWLQVDLGSAQQVSQAVVSWEAATANDYRIEGSPDGRAWEQLARVQKTSDELRNAVDLTPTKLRYVRVIGLPVTRYGLSIYEFELYGGYTITCAGKPVEVPRQGTATLTASITPSEKGDVVSAYSLDEDVAEVKGKARLDGSGRIEVDLRRGSGAAGKTAVLLTHANGQEVGRCEVLVAD
ncbi:discoidin domain-containing protein [Kineosporia sp. NBRC 101677]|uniref:discoidin domain-containing protein n=1 Tax=Kineosporia sp. NBRC 101677 TaxID=3032197 RepID=UPI002553151F|nr:discoidin domain-containing protein [Kineosporia sp. NBRC 101677]